MKNYAIEARNLKLNKARKNILDVDQFRLGYGEVMALIGPNGAGKSTLMQVLALLQRPDAGDLFIHGEQVTPKKELALRRRMAVVFQEPLLLDTTVCNNVASGLFIRGFKKDEAAAKVMEWLHRLGIAHLAHRSARFLSGGEAQRVSLARALVLEPEVLFLDEPFSALDYPTRKALIREIGGILQATRISTLLVTHDHNEIPLLAEKVAVIEGGKIVQCCDTREAFTRPANETVAALLGVLDPPPGDCCLGAAR